jgi:hypothetical protein
VLGDLGHGRCSSLFIDVASCLADWIIDMTSDQLITIALEAGFSVHDGILTGGVSDLRRTAELVAAHEREACAKLCEEEVGVWPALGPKHCAEAIRARSQS